MNNASESPLLPTSASLRTTTTCIYHGAKLNKVQPSTERRY
jgi:hypothetical protein